MKTSVKLTFGLILAIIGPILYFSGLVPVFFIGGSVFAVGMILFLLGLKQVLVNEKEKKGN